MGSINSQKVTQAEAEAKRRSTRLAVSIPITVVGKNKDGQEFRENTRTLIVSKHGAKLIMVQQVAVGADVVLTNRALGRSVRAAVVWVGQESPARDFREVGVQLVDPENVWGLEFSPEDWNEALATGTGSLDPKLPPPGAPAKAVRGAVTEAPTLEAGPETRSPSTPSTLLKSSASLEPVKPVMEESLNGLQKQIDQATHAALIAFGDKLLQFSKQAYSGVQLNLQDLAKELEAKTGTLLKREFAKLLRQAEYTHASLQTSVGEARELQEGWDSEAQKAQLKFQYAADQAVEKAVEKLSEQMQGAESVFSQRQTEAIEHTKAQIEQLTQTGTNSLIDEVSKVSEAAISQFRREMEGAAEKTSAELASRWTQSVDEQIQAVVKASEASLQQSLEKSLEHSRQQADENAERVHTMMGAEAEKMQQAFADRITEWMNNATKSIDSVCEQAVATLRASERDFQHRLQQYSEDFPEMHAKAFDTQLRHISEQVVADAAAQLEKLAASTLDRSGSQLNDQHEQLVRQTSESLKNKLAKMLASFESEPGSPDQAT